mgnify:CR=1 FL=1
MYFRVVNGGGVAGGIWAVKLDGLVFVGVGVDM